LYPDERGRDYNAGGELVGIIRPDRGKSGMSKRKKIAIYAGLLVVYLYIWFDGGTIGHYIAVLSVGTALLFLLLNWAASKADKGSK